MKKYITAEELRELLHYDKDDGKFFWKVSRGTVKAGRYAGHPDQRGYLLIAINKITYKAHRLAWLYVYGEWPKDQIDHINGVIDDNRICNLRDVSTVINQQNRKKAQITNTTGFLGVSPDGSKFKAQIMIEKKKVHLGNFLTPEEAHKAYLDAKRLHHKGCTL